jgi:ribosomal protein S18 acetylase RimI-like enzyme
MLTFALNAMIRIAVLADVPDIARLHVKTWQIAYRGYMPDAYLDALEPAKRAVLWSDAILSPDTVVLVAAAGTSIVGFCSLLPARDDDAKPDTGEIAAIYVDPPSWRSGVGRSLVEGGVEAARQRKFAELTLWVLNDNVSARRFYEACGFEIDGSAKTEQRLGFSSHEIRYRRSLAS